jgi:hypothetical protein
MDFLDLCGAPGSGKSTLADHFWGPHSILIESRLPPRDWLDWLNEVTRLFHLIKPHPTFPAALRMVNRSVRKMATVARMRVNEDLPADYGQRLGAHKVYIQTGLVQRGLGFGWRLNDMGKDLNEIRHYFELMPVSIGVAVTRCPQEIVEARNHARKLNPRTAHEDRAHMVALMQPAIEIAIEVLTKRGVPVHEVDTTQPIDNARAYLLYLASGEPSRESQMWDLEVDVLSPPPWWR